MKIEYQWENVYNGKYLYLVTLYEAAPKDKKQKEDKSVPIGQAILDLWPLLKGETQVPATVVIHPIPGSFLETQTEQNQVFKNYQLITLINSSFSQL